MVQRTWRRPLTLIYDRNYKYGNSLYREAISEIERRYAQSMALTKLSYSVDSLGYGTLNPAQVLPEPKPAIHLQSVLTSDLQRPVRSVPDVDSYFLQLPRRAYRHLIADPFNYEEKARARRRMRREMVHETGDPNSTAPPTVTLTSPAEQLEDSYPYVLYPYWRRPYPVPYLGDFSIMSGRCQQLQSGLETARQRVLEVESKLRCKSSSLSESKRTLETSVVELEAQLLSSGRENSELKKIIKRQARHIEEMQSLQDELQRHLGMAQEEMVRWQHKCNDLQYELDGTRHAYIA